MRSSLSLDANEEVRRLPENVSGDQRSWWRGFGQAMVLLVLMYTSLGGYLLVLNWRGPRATLSTYIPLDDLIPFRPEWVWVYLIPYLIGPIIVGLLRPSSFRWYVSRALTIVSATLLLFIVLPTRIEDREPATTLGGWTRDLYDNMVAMDSPPANAAPSFHVSLTCLLALALWRDFPRWWPLILLGIGLVWLSTLLTKQHHLVDVVSGILLTCVVVLAWPAPRKLAAPG